MKLLIIFLYFFISVNTYGQDTIYKKQGYCGSEKLRDINAPYGQVTFTLKMAILAGTAVKQFVFDYGQTYKKDKEALVSDSEGQVITFSSVAQVVNFFYYNGWDYVSFIEGGGSYIILFKKRGA